MTLVAGVDIGNSTTEIVIADEHGTPVRWDRRPTRGIKGSLDSGAGAARLLARMEVSLGRRADLVALTPQSPVTTMSAELPEPAVDTGRVMVVSTGSSTPAGTGLGAGRPVDIASTPAGGGEDIVLVARDPLGFQSTVAQARAWLHAGHPVVGILLAGDEAVLVSARLDQTLPVADCIDPDAVLTCARVLVEVARPGDQVRAASDPIRLSAALGLDAGEHADAVAACARVQGSRSAVLGVLAHGRAEPPRLERPGPEAWVEWPGTARRALRNAREPLAGRPLGIPVTFRLPHSAPMTAADVWLVDLDRVAGLPGLHPGTVANRTVIVSAMTPGAGAGQHVTGFRQEHAGSVRMVSSEAEAGRLGALTTPGASADATVVDLGGGSVDATRIGPRGLCIVSAAGSGSMLTIAVAEALGIASGTAEWVKRGPASRIESPHLAVRETGVREFLEPPAPAGAVGWLTSPGPGGPLPFAATLELGQWRAVRQALKRAVFADNLSRVLRGLGTPGGDLLLVGGPAGDDELLDSINGVLPGMAAGRGNVAGRLGHRWAVAYGLVLAVLG
ncbi:MAG: diol dehydratase reactivase ATPase-like domain-containing protein [Actinomycetota bacterium]|nr:diol dehydratase reactivase ATPase-like domain-containing protein [Actinomycetota bacterium]